MRLLVLVLTLGLSISGLALASDGLLEINQTCAVNTGCFPGDTPGFPVTITSAAGGRSFRMTSDLGPLAETQTAIDSTQVGVSIDLGGFRIFGVSVCSGVPVVSCLPAATGFGIDAGANTVVTNGEISGMGTGVSLDFSGRVEKMNVYHNSGRGIALDNESIAEGNISTSNGGNGIDCRNNCIIRGNTVTGNHGTGINAQAAAVVSQNSARVNGASGITTSFASTVTENTTYQNTVTGITAGTGSLVSGNTAFLNSNGGLSAGPGSTISGNSVGLNTGNGILTSDGSNIQMNSIRQNTGVGILNSGGASAYRDNIMFGNTGGTVTGGRDAGGNVCNSAPSCP